MTDCVNRLVLFGVICPDLAAIGPEIVRWSFRENGEALQI
jgi:hypothetical protein